MVAQRNVLDARRVVRSWESCQARDTRANKISPQQYWLLKIQLTERSSLSDVENPELLILTLA